MTALQVWLTSLEKATPVQQRGPEAWLQPADRRRCRAFRRERAPDRLILQANRAGARAFQVAP